MVHPRGGHHKLGHPTEIHASWSEFHKKRVALRLLWTTVELDGDPLPPLNTQSNGDPDGAVSKPPLNNRAALVSCSGGKSCSQA